MKTQTSLVTKKEKKETRQELAKLLAEECNDFKDINTMLKSLFSDTVEQMLECEMDEHLGYDKNSILGNNSGNSRNGHTTKTIATHYGESEISVPRDRNGEFEPRLIEKYQTKGQDIENQVLALYGKGTSTRDIEAHLEDIYGVKASPTLISRITDKVLPEAREWQNRPLESIYPIVFFDGIFHKIRIDGKVRNVCSYTVLGVNSDGIKEILGYWTAETESASFWTSVCNDLKNRGVNEIFIACHDNLNGIDRAINTVFPKTQQQNCIIHQIRNSTKFVSYKDIKELMADLKLIYGASTKDEAELRLTDFAEKWDKKYPQISKSWLENWEYLSEFFKYPEEVRRLIYTTNAVEGFHRMLRKYTKNKSSFPTEDALLKSNYLAIAEISRKWSQPIRNWGVIWGQLSIFFDGLEHTNLAV